MRHSIKIASLVLLIGLQLASKTEASDFTWVAGSDVAVPLLNSQDADAGVVQNGPNLDIQTALEFDWSRYRGTTLDNLVKLAPAQRDASFTQLNGDIYWTNGIWQDTDGKRYAIVHVEYNYVLPKTPFLWKRRIGLATSSDQGANWHYEGDILTTNPARPGNPGDSTGTPLDFQDFGCGDTYLCIDRRAGYFYVYYMTAWVYTSTGWRTAQAMNVARCPISAKMAPGQWTKWRDNAWTSPGLGGIETGVFNATDAAVVHFNTYLNAFVAIGHDSDSRSWISTATSLAAQNWQPRDYTFPQRLYWYNWPIDPVTHDRYEIGQTLRLYSAQANVGNVATKYFTLTLHRGSNLAPTAAIIQPEEGAAYYTPGPISIVATANDDTAVTRVEFFANQLKLGELTTAPYIFLWKNIVPGNYRIAARSTDPTGAATESAGVDITVSPLSFSQWKTNHQLPINTAANTPGPTGRPILLDYALNLDYEDLPRPAYDGSQLTLTYSHSRSDVTYQVERSPDLQTWTTADVNQGTPSPILTTASTPLLGTKHFLHLKITPLP